MSAPHYTDGPVTVWHGDCIDVMRQMPDNSVDAVVTDPPYNLTAGKKGGRGEASVNLDSPYGRSRITTGAGGFMGKGWDDYDNYTREDGSPGSFQHWCEDWAREAYRLLKPGGHLLAFGGSRTWHRLTSGIEDAGFEIRDSIAWLYGSGFAKSWNFGTQYPGPWCECRGESLPSSHAGNADLSRLRENVHTPAIARGEGEHPHLLTDLQRDPARPGVGEARTQGPSSLDAGERSGIRGTDAGQLQPVLAGRDLHRAGQGLPDGPDARTPAGTGERLRGGTPARHGGDHRAASDATRGGAPHQPRPGGQPAGEPAPVRGSHGALDDGALRDGPICPRCGGLDQAYKGAGSALKPAFEPIVVARKPLVGTIAQNVARYGTGALNIDGSRIAGTVPSVPQPNLRGTSGHFGSSAGRIDEMSAAPAGRWPANVVLDTSQAAALDAQSGERPGGAFPGRQRTQPGGANGTMNGGWSGEVGPARDMGDSGGASRFFYTAKASTDERPSVDGIAHPTVKPVDLMRWLVKLVTPPGGTVLEPFAGSGTTVEAAVLEGFHCIAIEREADYLPLILKRIRKPHAVGLDFGEWEA